MRVRREREYESRDREGVRVERERGCEREGVKMERKDVKLGSRREGV